MSEKPEPKRYCFGCKRKHTSTEVGGWPDMWETKILNGKKVRWCRNCIDCTGCGFIHKNDTGFTRTSWEGDKRIQLCGKWARATPPSPQKKMENLSPQEVLSGVQYGMDEQKGLFSKEANSKEWSKSHAEGVKELKEALS